MTILDVLIVVLILGAAAGAWRLGFLRRVLSWLTMAFGLFVALRMLPIVLGWFPEASSQAGLLLTLLTLLTGAFLGQAVGLAIGTKIRVRLPSGWPRHLDHGIGAVVGAALAVALVWLALPVMADTPGWASEQARASAIAEWMDRTFPDAPDTMQAVRVLVGDDQFPQVFDSLRRSPDLGPPPPETGIPPDVNERVVASVVRISGIACQRQIDGSGFVVGVDTVVTNAHVVAGEPSTTVIRSDGSQVDAQVVAFDPNRDLAVLRVPGLDRPALPIGESSAGARGGVYGYPRGGPLRIAPFEVAREIRAVGRDIYGRSSITRQVLEVAADLSPGDSGGALVDSEGRVVGVAFAIAPDRANVAYALATSELRAVVEVAGNQAVDTGACLV